MGLQQVAALVTVLGFTQTASTTVQMDFGWPLAVLWFSNLLGSIVNFDVMSASVPECSFGSMGFTLNENGNIDPFVRWYLGIVVPFSPVLCLCVTIVCVKVAKATALCPSRLDGASSWLQNKALRCMLLVSRQAPCHCRAHDILTHALPPLSTHFPLLQPLYPAVHRPCRTRVRAVRVCQRS
jgi:hypothetical protein